LKFDFTPKLTSVSHAEYCRRLRKRGAKELGDGAFSVVYQHPTKKTRVLKVNKCDELPTTDGYYMYVKCIASLRKRNPFLPRIFSVQVFKRPTPGDVYDRTHEWYFVVELEKLVPYDWFKVAERYAWFRRHINSKIVLDPEFYDEDQEAQIYEAQMYVRTRRTHNKALIRACKLIKRLSKSKHRYGQFAHDNHIENTMWRVKASKIHPVFTDPIS